MRLLRLTRSLALVSLLLGATVLGCRTSTPGGPTPSVAVAAAATPEPGPADLLADWRGYAEPEGATWPTEPLADERWAQVTAELGCVGRAHHGNPGAHRAAMNKVLAHGRTTADAVMEYGIGVNADPTRAHALGGRVAEAVQRCR